MGHTKQSEDKNWATGHSLLTPTQAIITHLTIEWLDDCEKLVSIYTEHNEDVNMINESGCHDIQFLIYK